MARKRSRARRVLRRARRNGLGLATGVALAVLVVAYLGVLELSRPHVSGDELRFDTFVALVEDGRVRNAHLLDEDAYVVGSYVPAEPGALQGVQRGDLGHDDGLQLGDGATPAAGTTRRYNAPLLRGTQRDLLELLLDNRVPISVDQQVVKRVASLATILLPSLILVVLFAYLILSYRRGSGLFGIRSGARRVAPSAGGLRFADVAGQDAAVAELRELQQFLADPARFSALGAELPRGVLLYGPPGCGKTMLARALASEAGASFYAISGSDFVELYVGVGASRVRELFKEARENAPALIFIDELDSIGRARDGGGAVSAHREHEQALNQVLAEMDGFATEEGVIVIAATNRADILDPALLRPGRFDRTIGLERPDDAARLSILEVHTARSPLAADVDLGRLAGRAIGLTGADLASVANDAALRAGRAGRSSVAHGDLEAALDRLLEAPERQRRLSLRDRSIGRRSSAERRVTFADVAGMDDALAEVREVRDYLADPERFSRLGARVPHGILVSGPPGCGKTLLARAVAGEANAAFLSAAGSDFVQLYVGQGAARVRDLFAEAASVAPAIVFIDELDGVGGRRPVEPTSGNREQEQTLNQILVELDGFQERSGVIVMAATNRPDMLDPALVRPGRFDRLVTISVPDRDGRLAVLRLHAASKRLDDDVDLGRVAEMTRGFSGADLANVLNEAALLTARHGLEATPMELVEEGVERAALGIASRGVVLSDHERLTVAYHEAGHALMAAAVPGAAMPHKLSILPRGGALGRCTTIEPHDQVVMSRPGLIDQMAVRLGGWAAERIVFGHTGSGVAADVERVTEVAHRMVRDYGMSERLGPIAYRGRTGDRAVSEATAQAIDAEVRQLVEEASARALSVLTIWRQQLDAVAQALLARETLSAGELAALSGPAPSPATTPA